MKSFVDTTILVDYLLKSGETKTTAKAAVEKCSESFLPQYAIKEFKAGALQYFVWFHNKLSQTNSFLNSIMALQRLSVTPQRNRLSTAIQALYESYKLLSNKPLDHLIKVYGDKAKVDNVLCDRFKLTLKRKIISSWKNRRKFTTKTGNELECYTEIGPNFSNNLFSLKPNKCITTKCCLSEKYRELSDDLEKIKNVISNLPKDEHKKRFKILREFLRKKNYVLSDSECRKLGDIYFVCFCPRESFILTTNVTDHSLMAEVLDKNVKAPTDLN